jgi:hypothetical protein
VRPGDDMFLFRSLPGSNVQLLNQLPMIDEVFNGSSKMRVWGGRETVLRRGGEEDGRRRGEGQEKGKTDGGAKKRLEGSRDQKVMIKAVTMVVSVSDY